MILYVTCYKYFASLSDLDAIHITPLLTSCENQSKDVMERHISNPSAHYIQKNLAKYMTILVHDEDLANQAESLSETLFSNDMNINLSSYNFEVLLDSSRFKRISRSSFGLKEVTIFVFLKQIFSEYSSSHIRNLVKSGAIRINRKKITSLEQKLRLDELNHYVLINNGKKQFFVIKLDN